MPNTEIPVIQHADTDNSQTEAVAVVVAETKASVSSDAAILAAQRKDIINILWERVQAVMALSFSAASIYSALFMVGVPDMLANATFTILGFYFGRVNHARTTPTDNVGL
jgi:hypothetical protein